MTDKTRQFILETLIAVRDSKRVRIGAQHYSVTLTLNELNEVINELTTKTGSI